MMRSVVTLFVFSNLVDIQRARPIENETETTPSPFDDDLGFTTPSTDKGLLQYYSYSRYYYTAVPYWLHSTD